MKLSQEILIEHTDHKYSQNDVYSYDARFGLRQMLTKNDEQSCGMVIGITINRHISAVYCNVLFS